MSETKSNEDNACLPYVMEFDPPKGAKTNVKYKFVRKVTRNVGGNNIISRTNHKEQWKVRTVTGDEGFEEILYSFFNSRERQRSTTYHGTYGSTSSWTVWMTAQEEGWKR